jgi:translation initiation factor IF-3
MMASEIGKKLLEGVIEKLSENRKVEQPPKLAGT